MSTTVSLTRNLAAKVRALPVGAAGAGGASVPSPRSSSAAGGVQRSVGGIHSSGVQDHFWNPVTPIGHTLYTWTGTVTADTPAARGISTTAAAAAATPEEQKQQPQQQQQQQKKKQKKQQKQPKPAGGAGAKADQPVFSRFDFRVGHILECKAVEDSRSLLISKIDVGEPEPRQILSGLKAYYKPEEIQGTKLIAVCNLKPSKLMGLTSYGMVLCAKEGDKVEIIRPPADANPGDPVSLEGEDYTDLPKDVNINAKKKNSAWALIEPLLKTNDDLAATCEGKRMLVNGQPCLAQSLKQAIIS